jgi:hypothetical protein
VSCKGDRIVFVRNLEDGVGEKAVYKGVSNGCNSPAAVGNQEDDEVGDKVVDKGMSNESDSTAVISN